MSRIVVLSISIVIVGTVNAASQNTVTFDNQSGEPALVKLLGPASKEVDVTNGTRQTVTADAGQYVIKVRYGVPGKYHYTKGEEFRLTDTSDSYTAITITLHMVPQGNYRTYPIAPEEFGRTDVVSATPTPHAPDRAETVVSLRIKYGKMAEAEIQTFRANMAFWLSI